MNAATTMQPQQQQAPPHPQSIWGTVNGQPLKIPVVGVTGEHDSGKSTFISSIDPMRTCMIDAEESTVSYNIPFARRYNLYEEMAQLTGGKPFRPIQSFEWFKNLVENVIHPGDYTVVAVDPVSDIEHGLVDWVKLNHDQFNLTKNQLDNAPGLLWGAVNEYWKAFIGIMSSKVQTFAYTVHMGSVWENGRPVKGKRKAKGKSSLKEVTSLFLTLDRSPFLDASGQLVSPGAPVGWRSGGKARLAHINIDPQSGLVNDVVPILPPRIPNCTPATIRAYIAQPPDWAHLKPEEQYVERPLTPQEEREREDERLQTQLEIETAALTRAQLLASAGLAQVQQLQQAQSPLQQSVQIATQQQVAAQQQPPAQQQPVQPQPAQANPVQQFAANLAQGLQGAAQQQPPAAPQLTSEQIEAQRQAETKARQAEQERIAAEARAAVANPTAAGKEVGPSAPAAQTTVAEPLQEHPAHQPANGQATEADRAAVQKECMALFAKLGFNQQTALAKLREYNPEAQSFKGLTDDQLASLHGFLSDSIAVQQGIETRAEARTQGN